MANLLLDQESWGSLVYGEFTQPAVWNWVINYSWDYGNVLENRYIGPVAGNATGTIRGLSALTRLGMATWGIITYEYGWPIVPKQIAYVDPIDSPQAFDLPMEPGDMLGLAYYNSWANEWYDTSIYGPYDIAVEWEEPPPPPTPLPGCKVYELDKGWSFDGAYIPHFVELNWYFGDDPFTSKSIQKVRIHGLTKGLAQLQLSVAGMQTEYDSDYTEPQFISLPRNAAHISSEYIPVTNYVDSSNWGLSLQLKFEGSNTDLNKPEPSHVLQVLALQGSPQENGKRNN